MLAYRWTRERSTALFSNTDHRSPEYVPSINGKNSCVQFVTRPVRIDLSYASTFMRMYIGFQLSEIDSAPGGEATVMRELFELQQYLMWIEVQ
jgi:hypothetical protein